MKRAHAKVARDVAALGDMSLAELRMEWERHYGAAPRHRSVDLLRRVLTWRMQADVNGCLDAATRRLITKDGPPCPCPIARRYRKRPYRCGGGPICGWASRSMASPASTARARTLSAGPVSATGSDIVACGPSAEA